MEAALPATLLQEILAFAHAPALIPAAAPGVASSLRQHYYDFAKRTTEPSTQELLALASVSKTWRNAVHTILDSHKQRVYTLAFTIGNEEREQKQYETYLAKHGRGIQDLRICISANTRKLWWEVAGDNSITTDAASTSVYSQWIEWEHLLTHVPNVQRLDLSKVPLHHFSIGEILEVASLRCPHIQALVMPRKERIHAEAVDAVIDETFRVLYSALARWYQAAASNDSGGSGLRQLTVPNRDEYDRSSNSNQFLDVVTKFCPNIEYLDGWKRTYNDLRFVVSDESWCLSSYETVWSTFCATCVHLREFSWVVVPFSDAFFLPFGKYAKPRLTHLQLTYNAKAPFRIRRSEYSTNGLCAVVQACPRLQVLDVILHRIQPSHAFVYPHLDEMIDAEVFNDEFISALATSCPLLESVRIREVGRGSSVMSWITDTGLRALAALKELRAVDLQGARCSAQGILSLVQDYPSTVGTARSSKVIKLRELGTHFGDVVTELLHHFSSNPLCCDARKPLVVSLSSRRGFVFKTSFLEDACAAIKDRSHLRFVAVYAEKSSSSNKDGFARVIDRTWLKKDVARVGKVLFYTHIELLCDRMQQRIGERISDTCIVKA